MKDTRWVGPKGSTVDIRAGSRQPPRWALLLIDRVLATHRPNRRWIELRWVRCSRGCGHGYSYGPHMISIYEGTDPDDTRHTVLHELAHSLNTGRDRHGDGLMRRFRPGSSRQIAGHVRKVGDEDGLMRREHLGEGPDRTWIE